MSTPNINLTTNQPSSALAYLKRVEQDGLELGRLQEEHTKTTKQQQATLKKVQEEVDKHLKQQMGFLSLQLASSKLSRSLSSAMSRKSGYKTNLRKMHALIYLSQQRAQLESSAKTSLKQSVHTFGESLDKMWEKYDGFTKSLDRIEDSIERAEILGAKKEKELQEKLLKLEKENKALKEENKALKMGKMDHDQLIQNLTESVAIMQDLRNGLSGVVSDAQAHGELMGSAVRNYESLVNQEQQLLEKREEAFQKNHQQLEDITATLQESARKSTQAATNLKELSEIGVNTRRNI